MPLYTELSTTAQTMYAQLLDAAVAADYVRSVADLNGSFSAKTVKGKQYCYFQYTEPSGKLRQLYVGPADSPAVQALIAQKAAGSSREARAQLARSSMALGCTAILPRHYRVIQRLSEYGFFKAGGVLIGTHAFLAYGNMLGVAWGDSSRTQDIDFAHAGKNLAIALPADVEVQTHEAIQSLEMGFLPISGLAGSGGATYLNPKEPDFRLDFLTTLHRGGEKPFEHPQLHVALQPLKFLEFSLENVQQAVLFCADGAVVVNIPHPARYALHKLIVFGERTGAYAVKGNKDLLQAAGLLSLYKQTRPWEVEEAWEDLLSRGKGWSTRALRGLKALEKGWPEIGVAEWLKSGGDKG